MTMQSKRRGKTFGLALFAGLFWSVAALWSWNTFMVDLLGLPQMAFRHAIALCLLGVSAVGALTLPMWVAHRERTKCQ
jgi:hypothetical protein